MPSKKTIFTPLSILFRPHQKPAISLLGRRFLVEAPGTAPGSNRFITPLIYRHSRPEDRHGWYSVFRQGWEEVLSQNRVVRSESCSAAQERDHLPIVKAPRFQHTDDPGRCSDYSYKQAKERDAGKRQSSKASATFALNVKSPIGWSESANGYVGA